MLEIPPRLSLPAQTAAALRKSLDQGTWKEFLPGERRLCELFKVSRPTLRSALSVLAKEGRIEIRQGRSSRILSPRRQRGGARGRLIAIVTHDASALSPAHAHHSVTEMRLLLAEHGFATETFVFRARGAAAQRHTIEAFVRQNQVFCCLLLWSRTELQQWFAANAFPALVLGSCHASVRLPSLDVDFKAVCRHAAGTLLGKGHRRLALIVPDSGRPGTLASEEGFRAAGQRGQDEAELQIVRHNGTAQHLGAKLDLLFAGTHPPTGLVVAQAQQVFNVLLYLLKRGLSVPGDVSIIARDPDGYFAGLAPPLSHYYFQRQAFNHRLTRLMLQMLNQGGLPIQPYLISPRYFPGGTVRSLA